MVRLVFVTFLSAVLLGTVLASNTPFRPYYLPPFFLHIFNISKITNEIGGNFSLNQQNTSESLIIKWIFSDNPGSITQGQGFQT
ncbi:hypothetical protein BLOT_002797 [Blomia tropicalis]|nr:hypothetical protein BLOT_002797 [Blomia tropicalis]